MNAAWVWREATLI